MTPSQLNLPHQPLGPVLQRLGHVRGLDIFAPSQVGDRPRQFQDAVVGAGREIELAHAQHPVAGGRDCHRFHPVCVRPGSRTGPKDSGLSYQPNFKETEGQVN
jgi:hypothetical protein